MNAMRFALDDAQFAIGKEVRHRERGGLRDCGVGLSSHHERARGDPGKLMLDVVAEHFSCGADRPADAGAAKIKEPVHPEPDRLAERVLQQPHLSLIHISEPTRPY